MGEWLVGAWPTEERLLLRALAQGPVASASGVANALVVASAPVVANALVV